MKPTTKLEKQIVELKNKLKPLSPSQKNWGFANLFESIASLNKNTLTCFECKHKWNEFPGVIMGIKIDKSCICPNCNQSLKVIETAKRTIKEQGYLSILTTINNIQIIRYFFLIKTFHTKSENTTYHHEVMQHWIDQKGKIVYLSKQCSQNWTYCDNWINSTKIEIVKPKSQASIYRHQIQPDVIYPRIKLTPELKRNGFTGNSFKKTPCEFISLVITNPKIETLLKSKRTDFIENISIGTINENWPQIKLAIKHNYFPSNYPDWIDQINLLKHFNKDIHSPKYICEKNLHHEHQKLVIKKQKQIQQQKLEDLRKNINQLNEKYTQQKSKYFEINFSDDTIHIKVLNHIYEFYKESETLKHCLFSREYFKKQHSLILSARINNEPIETIELSLENFKIIQSRGLDNKPTQYHNQIINLVESNLNLIKKIHRQKQKA